MRLYLLRHADAEPQAESDAARVLTARGIAEAGKVGAFCRRHHIAPDVVLHSPYQRARQTAELAMGPESMEESWLASGMRPDDALRELRAFPGRKSVMLVGHEPDLSQLAAALLGLATNASIPLHKASLTAIEVPLLSRGAGSLEFAVPVGLM